MDRRTGASGIERALSACPTAFDLPTRTAQRACSANNPDRGPSLTGPAMSRAGTHPRGGRPRDKADRPCPAPAQQEAPHAQGSDRGGSRVEKFIVQVFGFEGDPPGEDHTQEKGHAFGRVRLGRGDHQDAACRQERCFEGERVFKVVVREERVGEHHDRVEAQGHGVEAGTEFVRVVERVGPAGFGPRFFGPNVEFRVVFGLGLVGRGARFRPARLALLVRLQRVEQFGRRWG